ncbi:MAG TPA: F0F1 ATP synthase subunit B [Planctomycetota bacterium]
MTLSILALVPALSGGEGGGFNPIDFATGGNLFWTLAIFLVSVPFIWGTVMGPVTRALEERDAKAERAIAAAEKASREAEEARARLEVTLGEAQASAARLVAEARSKAESRGHEIVEAAKSEAGLLLENARKAIRIEQDKAIAAIRNEVVNLSLAAASKVLDRKVDSETDRHFVTQLVAGDASSGRVGRG